MVISLMALLVAILLPALGAARESARQVVCKTRMRQLSQLAHVYTNDWSGFALPTFVTNIAHYSEVLDGPKTYGWTAPAVLLKAGYVAKALAPVAPRWDYAKSPLLCPSGIPRVGPPAEMDYLHNIANFNNFMLSASEELHQRLDGSTRINTGIGGSYINHFHVGQSYALNHRFQKDGTWSGLTIKVPLRAGELNLDTQRTLLWAEYRYTNTRAWESPGKSDYSHFATAADYLLQYRRPHRGGANFAALDGHVGSFDDSQLAAARQAGNQQLTERILGFQW